MVVNSVNRERVLPWAPLPLQCGSRPIHEELALESAPTAPRLWKSYVDDTCSILRKDDVDGLLHQHMPNHKIHHGDGGQRVSPHP